MADDSWGTANVGAGKAEGGADVGEGDAGSAGIGGPAVHLPRVPSDYERRLRQVMIEYFASDPHREPPDKWIVPEDD
jgi:hypothetical protein